MKKVIVSMFVMLSALSLNAQTTSKKMEKGDCSLGFDAVPVLNYFGNLLSSAGDNTVQMGYVEENTIVGSYMKEENKAYRGKVGISYSSSKLDSAKSSSFGVSLGAGVLKYRGNGNLLGYYGYEAGVGFASAKAGEVSTSSMNVGARAVLGAQYFFAPKMSVSAEYGWGPSYSSVKDGASSLNLGVDNAGGAIMLSLYF